jgi:hypothetical protein
MLSQLPSDRFDQILIIKRLFEDATLLSLRNDNFSLITALILSDLTVELSLKNVIGHFDPNYFNTFGKKEDLYFKPAWLAAQKILKENNYEPLKEKPLLYAQHEQRNLVQHTGSVPSKADVDKYLAANKRMLTHLYQSVFNADFDQLRTWSFIGRESLKTFLCSVEDALKNGNPGGALAGCYYVRAFLLESLKKSSFKSRVSGINFHSMNDSLEASSFKSGLERMKLQFIKNFDLLDTEMLLVGLGMSIIDTRRFLQSDLINISIYMDGGISKNISEPLSKKDATEACEFHLQYINRILRRINDTYPEIIDEIKIEKAFNELERIGPDDWPF